VPGKLAASPEAYGGPTAPLRALWTHQKGGFYHDGRFATLRDVVNHYEGFFRLGLTEQEKNDLVQHLLGL
jgi:cytochrome c peroxidase